jgi:hypothetical protein
MENKIKLGKYRHYKGGEYLAIGIAHHSESLEDMVVYKALYGDGDLWVRPLSMWCEEITVNGEKVPRFKFICEQ